MKFSNNTLFYPDNKALENAIEYYQNLLTDDEIMHATNAANNVTNSVINSASIDDKVTVSDNFIYTRGNFEQHRYSANVFTNAREFFEARLSEKFGEQSSLEPSPLEKSHIEYAKAQNSLGNILSALGQQQRNIDLFNKAIECFNQALEVLSQEDAPIDWAATQSNLGTALQALGRQESDSKILSKSIDAYTAALLVYSRKETPEQWATVMFQLGATFHTYGCLLKGNRTFQKSVVAYKNALAELDADNYALELAATHNNRGAVLHHLGESEKNPERLAEAIRAYETALTVSMEQQLPIHLAVLCRVNMATARGVLAELTKESTMAEDAADEFEIILECFRHSLQPLCLKHCEEQLNTRQVVSP
ncbi:MAG: tetratricopeptide repeat protein [Gammaproteobacteria bacterium]|nr:tetratricopeptide repeat protein [Gammaproteobacteria bacterium]